MPYFIDTTIAGTDWRRQHDRPLAKFSCEKDAPFEPDSQAGSGIAATVNGRSKAAKDRKPRLRVSAAGFLAALVLCLVVTPFVQGLKQGQVYEAVLYTLVMCTGLIASGSCRRLAVALVSFALAATWLNQLWPERCPALTLILPGVAFLMVVTASPALMVTGRAGSAIAAEIGIMRTSEQLDALELMGLNPLRYVVVPNVLASLLALPVLTLVFDVIGILGGHLVGVRLLGLNGDTYFGEMRNYVEMKDIWGGIYKALAFGLLIGWVCCYKGYHSRFGAEGVSAATTQAEVNTSVLILVCDYFVTSVVF